MMRSPRGFTIFEFLVVIMLISTLGVVLLDRMLTYQEIAEKAAMEQTVGILRSALVLQMAEKLVKGNMAGMAALAQDNPMDWLAEVPPNYVGTRFDPQPGTVPRGSWYFDLKDKNLVYRVRRGEHFTPDRQGEQTIRYQVRLVHGQKAQANQDLADKSQISGVVLALVEPYEWF